MGELKLGWPSWIGVVVDDLEAQRRFYRDILGLTEVRSGEGWVWFDLEGNLFELLAKSDEPQYQERRYQVGFAVSDIEAERSELTARGVEQITEIEGSPDVGYWCYFRDPEGSVFEIKQGPTRRTAPRRLS